MAAETDAFLQLNDAELAVLEPLGVRRAVSPGEYLYREGDPRYEFYVVLAGAVEIVVNSGGKDRVIARHPAGRFLGELNLLTGQRVFVSARVAEPGEVLAVPRDALRRLIATDASLSDKILAAFLARRAILMTGASSAIRVVGSQFSPDSGHVREFLVRNGVPHEWLDPDADRDVERLLQEFDVVPRDLPVVIVSGKVLRRPTPGVLADYLGLTVGTMPEGGFDLIVVGAGPAGLAAAVYGASEGLRTLVLEMVAVGGQAAPSDYPGGKKGDELTVEFTVLGIPCLGLNGGPNFKHSEAFSFQIATDNQEETDRYWNAIVGNGGKESQCGWCKDRWGLSWQITPRVLTEALAAGGGEAKRAFEAMMPMKKIDIATIEAARRDLIGTDQQVGSR